MTGNYSGAILTKVVDSLLEDGPSHSKNNSHRKTKKNNIKTEPQSNKGSYYYVRGYLDNEANDRLRREKNECI